MLPLHLSEIQISQQEISVLIAEFIDSRISQML